MALTLFENGWNSYGMDWENPDPYNPVYLQALQYAVLERVHLTGSLSYIIGTDNEAHYPCRRSVLDYNAYLAVYRAIKHIVDSRVFVYKPGEEPDEVQTVYTPNRTEEYADYWYYIPYYVFCPVSFKHVDSNTFSSFEDFLVLPQRNSTVSEWARWLKSAKEVISTCKYVRCHGSDLASDRLTDSPIDEYAKNRPSGGLYMSLYTGNAPMVSGELVNQSGNDTTAVQKLCTAWMYASVEDMGEYSQQTVSDMELDGDRYSKYKSNGCIPEYLNYITMWKTATQVGVSEYRTYGDLRVYDLDWFGFDWDTWCPRKPYIAYVLTGTPVVVCNIDKNIFNRETDYIPEYHLQYNALGYPFKKDEWVALNKVNPLGVGSFSRSGFVTVANDLYKNLTEYHPYDTLPEPEVPSGKVGMTYTHSGFCYLGAYADFSEGLKLK